MTRGRVGLEKRVRSIQEENKVIARKVARRLLGIQKFAYLRPVPAGSPKYVDGWKTVKTFDSKEEAHRYASRQHVQYWLIEEIFD